MIWAFQWIIQITIFPENLRRNSLEKNCFSLRTKRSIYDYYLKSVSPLQMYCLVYLWGSWQQNQCSLWHPRTTGCNLLLVRRYNVYCEIFLLNSARTDICFRYSSTTVLTVDTKNFIGVKLFPLCNFKIKLPDLIFCQETNILLLKLCINLSI